MSEEMSKEEREAWDKNPNVTLTLNGKSYRCNCGCNVFDRIGYDKNRYICNGCKSTFTAS